MVRKKKALQGPVVLVIIDGWGISRSKIGNAIAAAKNSTYGCPYERKTFNVAKGVGKCGWAAC